MLIKIADLKIWLAFLFILSGLSLDVSFGLESLRLGNIFILLVGLVCFCAFALKIRGSLQVFTRNFGFSDVFYLLFAAFAFTSLLWSPNAINSIFHGILLVCVWFVAVYLSTVPRVVITAFIIKIGIVCSVLSYLMLFISTEIALQPLPSTDTPELRGIFYHQLRLGLFCCIVLGVIAISYFNGEWKAVFTSRWQLITAVLFISYVMILSFARLYTFFALVAILVVFLLPSHNLVGRIYAFLGMTVFCMFVMSWDQIALYLDSVGIDSSLTGRTSVWEKTLELSEIAGFWGYGYPSFDDPKFDLEWFLYRPPHAHNSFIQAYFELGIIGLFIAIGIVLANFKDVLNIKDSLNKYSYSLYLFLLMLFGSLTGANYASKPNFLFIIFIFVFCIERNMKTKLTC